MTRFLQIHALSFYPPANLNRDDTGRPKTAIIGGAPRLRISSQALKRAWRTSDVFSHALDGHRGMRTQRIGERLFKALKDEGADEEAARKAVLALLPLFGKPKAEEAEWAQTEQLAFISPEEEEAALAAARDVLAGRKTAFSADEILRTTDTAADIAMFGRMLADNPHFNREAAVQVAHAFTTHRVEVEDDYYTAVDDLKTSAEDMGAGFVGELGFGAGLFYLYLCIDRALLLANLGNHQEIATTALAALVEAVATVSPRGKQPSFAARARAQYLLVERGDAQPRTLAGAFQKPVVGADIAAVSREALCSWRDRIDAVYGPAADARAELDVASGTGTLGEVLDFVREA